MKKPKQSLKPRNHVALAMIRSGKTHQVHEPKKVGTYKERDIMKELEECRGDFATFYET